MSKRRKSRTSGGASSRGSLATVERPRSVQTAAAPVVRAVRIPQNGAAAGEAAPGGAAHPSDAMLLRACDAFLELGWLAALVIAPLFFNPYSDRQFEPDKIALIRSIAILLAAVWLLKVALQRRGTTEGRPFGSALRTLLRTPLVVPAVLLPATYLLTTALSVTPWRSWWGSYLRAEGTYTMFSYVVLFAVVAANLRRRDQVERLVNTVLLTSVMVSLYGVMQHFKLELHDWGQDTSIRPSSTLGNAIFMAGYLIMALPLTAMRLTSSAARAFQAGHGFVRFGPPVGYGLIGLIQFLAILYSDSRGPWAGAVFGLFVWVVLMALRFKPRLALPLMASATVTVACLIILNIPRGPLDGLRNAGPLSRVSHVLEARDATNQVRVFIWQGVVQMILPHPPVALSDGQVDTLNAIRPLVGYGPESMISVFLQFYPPGIAQYERGSTWDRPHNETLHAVAISGVIGASVYLIFFGSLLYFGLKWFGLLGTRRSALTLISLGVIGGVGGAGVAMLWKGSAYVGLALPLGILLGLIAYLAWCVLDRRHMPAEAENGWRGFLLPALIGAIVAHFVEAQFGIAVSSTWIHLWVFGGVLLVLGCFMKDQPRIGLEEPSRAAMPAFVTSLVLLIVIYGFFDTDDAKMLLLLAVALVASILLLSRDLREACLSGVLSLGGVLAFALYRTATFGGATPSDGDIAARVSQGLGRAGVFDGFGVMLLLLGAGTALWLASEPGGPDGELKPGRRRARRARASIKALSMSGAAVGLGVLVLTSIGSYATNTRSVVADVVAKRADGQDSPVARGLVEQSARLAPHESDYARKLAVADQALAEQSSQSADRQRWLSTAVADEERAYALDPLDSANATDLARVHRRWAQMSADADQARQQFDLADDYYRQGVRLAPHSVALWIQWAGLGIERLDFAGAMSKLEQALSIDSTFNETYAAFGDLWRQRASHETDPSARLKYFEQASDYYRQAIDVEPRLSADSSKSLRARRGLAVSESALGRFQESIAAYEDLLRLGGQPGEQWAIHGELAQAYNGAGDKSKALENARKSLSEAPAGSKPAAQSLLSQLESGS